VIARRIAEVAGRAHACIAVSDALAERFAAAARLARPRVATVRNGVDLERFAPGDRRQARVELGLPTAGQIVLGVGRLVAGKGFAKAARAVRAFGSDVLLALVGDGPERDAIAAAGGDAVRLLGGLPPERIATAYRAADVLVLPSEREGWPNVVTEALACGVPVVATRVGGIPQILGKSPPAYLGALVEPGDEQALGAALRGVLATKHEPDRVRAFAERYGWQQPVEQLVATFRSAFGEEVA
jgi:glycosyltransferase involved in cell wall biosynthesis